MSRRILLLTTYYPEFLTGFYGQQPCLTTGTFDAQMRMLLASGFALGDVYPFQFEQLGWTAQLVVVNADAAQRCWAREHRLTLTGNIHDQRRQIVAAQVRAFQPDVLYVFEWTPLGDAFLAELKPAVRLLAGQIASPVRPERTYAAYDLMISSCPPMVEHFARLLPAAEYLPLAFDERVLARVEPAEPRHDVTFVGGYAPSHPNRLPWLERIARAVDLQVFGYGWEAAVTGTALAGRCQPAVWGPAMYRVLRESRLTLNLHAENPIAGVVDRRFANNMRLYEATGVGTCLLTDAKDNLAELFEPGREVLTFSDPDDCVAQIHTALADPARREAVARAGQVRTLRDHTYRQRIPELAAILERHLP